jgi:hypothetical protein
VKVQVADRLEVLGESFAFGHPMMAAEYLSEVVELFRRHTIRGKASGETLDVLSDERQLDQFVARQLDHDDASEGSADEQPTLLETADGLPDQASADLKLSGQGGLEQSGSRDDGSPDDALLERRKGSLSERNVLGEGTDSMRPRCLEHAREAPAGTGRSRDATAARNLSLDGLQSVNS